MTTKTKSLSATAAITQMRLSCACDLECLFKVIQGRRRFRYASHENKQQFFEVGTHITVLNPQLFGSRIEDRGRFTESIRILVPVDRVKQKCMQITTKRVCRSQQFQLRR